MTGRRKWRPQLTREECHRGWVFFLLYFLVFPFVMAGMQWLLDSRWSLYLSDAAANVLYYLLSMVLVLVVFWSFLRNGVDILLDYLPENLTAIGMGLVGGGVLHLLVALLPLPVEDPNGEVYAQQFAASPQATIAIVVLLMPVVEEVLFRGLVFGGLRRNYRIWGYVASVGLFTLYSVWTFAFSLGDIRYLLLMVEYLPMALALTWCYDKGGSIWSPVVLHMLFNAIRLFVMVR